MIFFPLLQILLFKESNKIMDLESLVIYPPYDWTCDYNQSKHVFYKFYDIEIYFNFLEGKCS
jgi:hypothetical protein